MAAVWLAFDPGASGGIVETPKGSDSKEYAVTCIIELIGKRVWEAIDSRIVAFGKEVYQAFVQGQPDKMPGISPQFDAFLKARGEGDPDSSYVGWAGKRRSNRRLQAAPGPRGPRAPRATVVVDCLPSQRAFLGSPPSTSGVVWS